MPRSCHEPLGDSRPNGMYPPNPQEMHIHGSGGSTLAAAVSHAPAGAPEPKIECSCLPGRLDGRNIPFSGQWRVELRVEILRAKPQASAIFRWNSDSVGHQPYTVHLNLPAGRMHRLITPRHWLHQGTHTLWWETNSECVIHEILITNGP